VPLPWYSSATFAQFPDETHASIQRTFVAPATRRQFCGFCGSHLSSWNEHSRDDAEHICLTVGSLLEEDQARLADLGFLPDSDASDDDASLPEAPLARAQPQTRGAPWFEEIVRSTRLGHFKQQRGGHEENGVRVEWEVTEWTDDDAGDESGSATPSKRKIGDVETEDAEMRSA
jgi:hypothetical protein